MANSDTPEVMNVSFSKNQIDSPSKIKTSPEPPPKIKLDQNFSSGKKKQEQGRTETNSKPRRPLSQKLGKSFMKYFKNSFKTSNTSTYTAIIENPVPPVKNQLKSTVDESTSKQKYFKQPSKLYRSESVSSFFQKPIPPPPAHSNRPSSQLATTMIGIREQSFHEEDEENEKEEMYNNSTDFFDESYVDSDEKKNDHDQISAVTRYNSDNRWEADDGSDLLKKLITLALLKDVVGSAVRSQQGNLFKSWSFRSLFV